MRPDRSSNRSISRALRPLPLDRVGAALGFLAGALVAAPSALAIGEVFAVNLRTATPQLRQFPADAPSLMGTVVGSTVSTYAMDFNTAGTLLYAIRNTAENVYDLGTIDLLTGAFTATAPVTGLTVLPTGLSIDPTDETFYVSTGTTLFTLDPSTGVLTTVGDFSTGGLMIDIAIDNNGLMYGHDIGTDALYSIDKTTGLATFIAGHGLAANFAQGMDFDPTTNTLYAAIYTGGGTGSYVSWDTTTGAITVLSSTTSFNVEMEMAIRAGSIASGACCLPAGTCAIASSPGCSGLGGLYSGDGTDCSTVTCPGPGACCLPNFACSVTGAGLCASQGGTFQGEGTVCGSCPPPPPGVFPEIEPNDSKAQATVVTGMVSGNALLGNSTGSSTTVPGAASADFFEVSTAQAAPGFYRHRLSLFAGGTTAHAATIRGLNQTAAAAGTWPCASVGSPGVTDTTVQTAFLPTGGNSRITQWYGFGKAERIYYRVTGTAATTANYLATLETTPVPIIDVGNFEPGPLTISTMGHGHTTDTDMWVYDADFNAIPGYGNDDNSLNSGGTGSGLNGIFTRPYAAGTYYLALSTWQLALSEVSPCDDAYRTGVLMDFPDSLVNSSTTINRNITFSIADAAGAVVVPALFAEQFEVHLFRFTVGAGGPSCPPDWNDDGQVNSQDISAFITDWLASVNQGTLVADFNGDGQVNSTDISAFITAWLDAVTNGC